METSDCFDDPVYADDDTEWRVEVRYQCPGRPLDADMEGELSFASGNRGFGPCGFEDGFRFATYCFPDRDEAQNFQSYVVRHFPHADTRLFPWIEQNYCDSM